VWRAPGLEAGAAGWQNGVILTGSPQPHHIHLTALS
jgi:hypothetical protein